MPFAEKNTANHSSSQEWLEFHDQPMHRELATKYSLLAMDPYTLSKELQKHFSPQHRVWMAEWISLLGQVRTKFQTEQPLVCDRFALEQSTGFDIASYKAKIWPSGARIADLCCGMGGDSFCIKPQNAVVGVDLDAKRTGMYVRNTLLLGKARSAIVGNALAIQVKCDFAQIDPARRTESSGNQRRAESLHPSLPQMFQRLQGLAGGMVKLPPGIDVKDLMMGTTIALPPMHTIHLGSRTDCREQLLLLGKTLVEHDSPDIYAVDVERNLHWFAFSRELQQPNVVQPVGAWIFEPIPVLVRSHLFPWVGKQLGLAMIDSDIAYMTGDSALPPTTGFQSYRVLDTCLLGQDRVTEMLRRHTVGKGLILKKRGVEVDPTQELRRLKAHLLPKDGKNGVLFYTRCQGIKSAILTEIPEGYR